MRRHAGARRAGPAAPPSITEDAAIAAAITPHEGHHPGSPVRFRRALPWPDQGAREPARPRPDRRRGAGARSGARQGACAQVAAGGLPPRTWSFYPGKNLGALGDGGAVLTSDDAELAEKVKPAAQLRLERQVRQHDVLGWNSRLDPVQAAILRVKLRHLDTWNTRRKVIARRYLDELAGQAGLTLPGTVPNLEHVFHMFVVRSPERDALREKLSALGIQTLIHYPIPPHRQAAYAAADFSRFDLRLTEQLHREVLSLPIGPHMGDGDVSHVVRALAQTTALPRTQPRAAGTRPGRS
jgi:hypothetical protein